MSAIVLSAEWQVGGGSAEPTLARVVTALERAGAEVADVGKHILPKVMTVLEQGAAAQFDAQGAGPIAGAWSPLTVPYAQWKEANFPGRPILQRSGALADALSASDSETVPGMLRNISGNSLEYGTSGIPYASFHQTGTGRMVARPPLDFGPDTEEGLQQAAAEGVREAIKEAWAGLLDFDEATFEGQEVFSGKKGGRYIRNASVGREYLKRRADGSVVKKSSFNRRGR